MAGRQCRDANTPVVADWILRRRVLPEQELRGHPVPAVGHGGGALPAHARDLPEPARIYPGQGSGALARLCRDRGGFPVCHGQGIAGIAMNARSHTLRNTLFSSVGLYTEYVLGMLTSII